jgi:hypothetical protein
MSPAQKQAAINTAIDTLTRLMDTAPDYGECGCVLTLHAGEVRKIEEHCIRTIQPGARNGQ